MLIICLLKRMTILMMELASDMCVDLAKPFQHLAVVKSGGESKNLKLSVFKHLGFLISSLLQVDINDALGIWCQSQL